MADRKNSSPKYGIPTGVSPGTHLNRPTLSTSQGGRVAVDSLVMALWEVSIGHSLEEIQQLFPSVVAARIPGFEIQPWETEFALVCLENAGLLSYSSLQEGNTSYPDGSSGSTGSTLPHLPHGSTVPHRSTLRHSPQNIPSQKHSSTFALQNDSEQEEEFAELTVIPESPFHESSDDLSRLVSIVIVAYNSLEWLEECFHSLARQAYTPIEFILVDNGSSDEAVTWFSSRFPESSLIRFQTPFPLSAAINAGIQAAKGSYYLILNPDTQLEPDTVSNLVKCLEQDPEAAAVAAKLKLLWTPGFLNGLGNFVGAISWGTDCGLGQIDLGQFDDWKEVPSACFAGALVRASIWQAVGPLDENLPMYYEDSEWCYRARLFGYKILAAPEATIYHALGSRIPGTQAETLSPSRLARVVFGRLHFITRLFGPLAWLRFFTGYLVEDLVHSVLALLRGQRAIFQAYTRAWKKYLTTLPRMLEDRRTIQPRRIITDRQLLALQKGIPPVMIWRGLPLLTWETIQGTYAPLILAGHAGPRNDLEKPAPFRTQVPEVLFRIFGAFPGQPGFLKRLRMIYQTEGRRALMERLGRIIQHRLRRP